MYRFDAKFINVITEEERTLPIVIEDQFFRREQEVFLTAMTTAYNSMKECECFESLQFISC